jgi:hypothetical protein
MGTQRAKVKARRKASGTTIQKGMRTPLGVGTQRAMEKEKEKEKEKA